MMPLPSTAIRAATQRLLARIKSPAGLVVAALCGIVLAFYHGLWLPGLVLVERDAFRVFLPFKQYVLERLSAGELPQWFPYEALGRSFIGITHSGVFHPFTALYVFFPVPDAYRASTLLSCLLGALGSFALGRTLNFSRSGALVAGLAFTLSGYVVSVTDNIVYLYSICLLPLFCLTLERALVDTRAWLVAPAALWSTVFLIGDVQTGYYYGFIALLWVAARSPRSGYESSLRMVLIGGLTVLVAGIQLGPTWAVFTGSERAHPEDFMEQALAWSTHPLRLVTILASPVSEHVSVEGIEGVLFGDLLEKYIGYFWAESLYLGVPVMGLAILGAWWRRDLRLLVLLGCLALLLALGRYGGLYEVLYHAMPFWSAFRYPEKFMGVFAFTAAMLAGAGVDVLRNGQGRLTPWLLGAVGCAIASIGLYSEAAKAWTTANSGVLEAMAREVTRSSVSLDASHALFQGIRTSAAQAFLFSAGAVLGVAMVAAGLKRQAIRSEWLLACLIALITLDLSRANLVAYHTGPMEAATFSPPLVEALRAREGALVPGRFRLVTLEENRIVIPEQLERGLGHYAAVIVARRQALDALHGAEFHIESAKRYLTGYKADLIAMIKQRIGLQAAGRLNVAYYIGLRSRLKDPQSTLEPVAELADYDLVLFRNPSRIKPRAYVSGRPERAELPVDLARLFARPDFLSGEVDVIEASDAMLPGPSTEGTATIERYAPEEVRVRVATPQPAVLILLDAFEEGWTATLENGAAVPIMRANALVRAVVAPAGAHVVTFRYETPLLRVGAAASLLGVLLCLGLIAHAWWMARANKSVP
jgi:hypothetical protein